MIRTPRFAVPCHLGHQNSRSRPARTPRSTIATKATRQPATAHIPEHASLARARTYCAEHVPSLGRAPNSPLPPSKTEPSDTVWGDARRPDRQRLNLSYSSENGDRFEPVGGTKAGEEARSTFAAKATQQPALPIMSMQVSRVRASCAENVRRRVASRSLRSRRASPFL